MKFLLYVRRLALWGALAACSIFSANAQSTYGGLRGIVTDGQGKSIAVAKVTLTDTGTNLARTTLTSEAGEYNFASVVPGAYKVETEQVGFKTIIGDAEDRCFGVLVNRYDHFRVLHPRQMLDRARDADGHVQLRRNDLAGLAHLIRNVNAPCRPTSPGPSRCSRPLF